MNYNIILFILIILVLSLIGYYWKKKDNSNIEHFQSQIIKDNYSDIYDTFYSNIYDKLFNSSLKNEFEIYNIKNYTLDKYKGKVNILDVGCGTGHHLQLFKNLKYNCIGLDKSLKMLSIARKNNPTLELVKGDYHNRSVFKNREFSHIICLFYTIYYSQDPLKVFQNFNYWLKPNGYLCIHLIHRDKFDPILEKSSSLIPLFNPQKKQKTRKTKTTLHFNNFKYISDWEFNKKKVTFTENFLFKKKPIIRKNVHSFKINKVSYYIKLLNHCGFKLIKIIDLRTVNHEFNGVYIFKKIYGK